MSNTQGLDALAALCGSSVAASEENAAAAAVAAAATSMAAPMNNTMTAPAAPSPQIAASLYAQQMQQAQAMQVQQVQQALMLQAQQQAAQALQGQVAQAAQPQAMTVAASASLPSQQQQLVQAAQAQLNMLQAAAVQQQQQQQHHQQQQQQQQQTNAFNSQVQAQSLAAQLLAAQQQCANGTASAVGAVHQSLAALSPALIGLTAAGGQILPGAVSSPPSLQVTSPNLQVTNMAQASPSTLAMPPPPKVVPSLPLNDPVISSKAKPCDTTSTPSLPASKPTRCLQEETSQPPIQDIIEEWEDKKQAKRAANRLSAHLSRKRKKMFIEDLKDENVELRRKEQILRSIPDLIVVFDSSGCISFVSHSITRFLDYTVEEIESTSFWDRLTEDSVRSIKSAFMDALAVKRPPDEDSTPLAGGNSMTVKMVHRVGDKGEDNGLLVSLKGVVHFAGESPECVCSIRPEGSAGRINTSSITKKPAAKELSSSSGGVKGLARPVGVTPSHQISDIDSVGQS